VGHHSFRSTGRCRRITGRARDPGSGHRKRRPCGLPLLDPLGPDDRVVVGDARLRGAASPVDQWEHREDLTYRLRDRRIDQLGTPEDIYARPQSEFVARFMEADGGNARYFQPAAKPGHAFFDLNRYTVDRLARAGVKAEALGRCTYADEAGFFSYRRATHRGEPDYGRQISAICLEDH
jgi:hypothetical protein